MTAEPVIEIFVVDIVIILFLILEKVHKKHVPQRSKEGEMAHQIPDTKESVRLAQVETELKRLGYDQVPSLRDEFAMAAMQGILASCHGPAWGNDVFPIAESCYAYADQMMEARK